MRIPSRLPVRIAGALLILTSCAADASRRDAPPSRPTSSAPSPADASSGPGDASDALPPIDDLEALVAFGLAHSPRLALHRAAWEADVERADRADTLPDPRVTWGEFLEEVQTRTGPQERRIGVSQAFPWPGTLGARERVAEREADAARERFESARLDVRLMVETAWYDYAFLGRELGITRELLALVRGLEPVVQGRVRAGGGQRDLLRLQVEIGRLEDDAASLEARRPAVWARLADALGVRVAGAPPPFPVLDEPDTDRVRTHEVAALWEDALDANPGLSELVARRRASRAAVELAEYERTPDLALGFTWFDTGGALDPSTPGSGDDPFMLSLSFSLPVWRGSYAAAEREARARARAASERLEAAETELRAQLEDAVYRVEDAVRRLRLYRETLIPRASDTLDVTLAAYRGGDASVLDLIDTEQALLEFELAYWRACRDALQGAARLDALVGGGSR